MYRLRGVILRREQQRVVDHREQRRGIFLGELGDAGGAHRARQLIGPHHQQHAGVAQHQVNAHDAPASGNR